MDVEHALCNGEEGEDVVIPDKIARPLVYSANTLLITSVISIMHSQYGIASTSILLWITSIIYWYAPRYSSPRRYADYAAVLTAVSYGSYVVSSQASR